MIIITPWCRASTSRNGLAGPSDHTEISAALASARADAAHLREENTRLLDLLSTVSNTAQRADTLHHHMLYSIHMLCQDIPVE